MQFLKLNFEVLDRPGRDAHVFCVTMIIVGDDCGGRFVRLVCGFIITSVANSKPSQERFYEDSEEEGG